MSCFTSCIIFILCAFTAPHLSKCDATDSTNNNTQIQTTTFPQPVSPGADQVGTTETLSKDQMQRQQIKCIIHNELSSERCSDVVASQTSDNDDLNGGCAKLEGYEDLVTALGCTYDDYNKLHVAICSWDGQVTCVNYYQMQRDLIAENEQRLKPTCSRSVSKDLKVDDLPTYCNNLLKSKESLVTNKVCTGDELAELEKSVCCSGQMCFLPDVDIGTRQGRVIMAIRKLSPRCSRTMATAVDSFSQPPLEACSALQSTREALLGGTVCTEVDYTKLQDVVCNDAVDCTKETQSSRCPATTPDPFANEREQRDKIQQVITNELNETCQNFMMEQAAAQISDPLEKTCKTFLDNRGFIVIGGQCSPDEYDRLKVVICGNAPIVVSNGCLICLSLLFAVIKYIL